MKHITLSLAALLTGCATPTSGVVPLSDGLHKIAHQGGHAWVTTEALKNEAVKEADGYCGKAGKKVRVIDTKHTPARPFGGWPEAEVLFRCE